MDTTTCAAKQTRSVPIASKTNSVSPAVITVCLNPTIDRIVEVPGLRLGGHVKGILRSRTPAGKAFNVSKALAALGIANTAMGFVGQDSQPVFAATARELGITPAFTPIAGTSRENTTLIDPENHSETHVRETGPTILRKEITALESTLQHAISKDTYVVFTGSLAPGLSVQSFGDMLSSAARAGARVVVDSSGPALREAIDRGVWMVKPNRQELEELQTVKLAEPQSLHEAMSRLADHVAVVTVTLGDKGAETLVRPALWRARVHVPQGELRSTVGCGDTFLAGYLAGLITSGEDHAGALRQAVAVSAASAMSELPAVFDPADVQRLTQDAELTGIA